MEKTIRMTRSEIARWAGAALVVVSAFIVNQVDIQNLKKENQDREAEFKVLNELYVNSAAEVAKLNGKMDLVIHYVETINDNLTSRGLNGR